MVLQKKSQAKFIGLTLESGLATKLAADTFAVDPPFIGLDADDSKDIIDVMIALVARPRQFDLQLGGTTISRAGYVAPARALN